MCELLAMSCRYPARLTSSLTALASHAAGQQSQSRWLGLAFYQGHDVALYRDTTPADTCPLNPLLGHSITYRIAVGPQAGRKVFTLQTLPACDSEDQFADTVGKVTGFSLHAGVAVKAHERNKLERLCRCIFGQTTVSGSH